MAVKTVLAVINVADFNAATIHYEKLFGRPADATPMDGLAEWHFSAYGGVQVARDESRAGSSSLTLVVTSLDEQLAALEAAGISAGPLQGTPGMVKVSTVTDREGNQINFAKDLTDRGS